VIFDAGAVAEAIRARTPGSWPRKTPTVTLEVRPDDEVDTDL
jgi:hypothetical protein